MIRRIPLVVVCALWGAMCSSPLFAQSAKVAGAVQPFVDRQELAGAVMLVADKSSVLTVEGAGWADVEAKRPMKPDSMFWIASQTKPICAATVMILVDEGKISLDDPIEKHLPEFNGQMVVAFKDDQSKLLRPRKRSITVRDTLAHISGMPYRSPIEDTTLDQLPLSARVKCYAMTPLDAQPGEKYQYSNCGINVAGRIVEVVSGLPYEEFLEKRLLQPLKMTDTTFFPSEAQTERIARAYKPGADNKGLAPTTIEYLRYPLSDRAHRESMPAGGLFSTAGDVARFYRMLLNGGELDGVRVLSAEAVAQLTKKQTGDALKDEYGLCFAVGGGTFGHGGAYSTNSTADPKTGLITIWLVQHAGFPGEGGKALETFRKAAHETFAKKQ